jgi:hypothetical protein
MPLGFDRDYNVINLGDSAELYAQIYDSQDDTPIPATDLASVQFTINRPDNTTQSVAGTVLSDGRGFLRYLTTNVVGEYPAVAKFTFTSGEVRSVRTDFEVIDPFNPPAPTDMQIVAEATWHKLEDLFDSEDGGPWLRDVTMSYFSKDKIVQFVPEALLDINLQNPPTHAVLTSFTTLVQNERPDLPLLAEGTLLAVIRHLMRSYVEQPLPSGAQIVYEDRRDYLQRWGTIYQIELQTYMRWLALWKRQFLGLGQSRVLVSNKAGRLLPAPLRTRNIGRGYY